MFAQKQVFRPRELEMINIWDHCIIIFYLFILFYLVQWKKTEGKLKDKTNQREGQNLPLGEWCSSQIAEKSKLA